MKLAQSFTFGERGLRSDHPSKPTRQRGSCVNQSTSNTTGLEKLHKTYADQGLAVLGFPCNQFASQDPGDDAQIANFCQKNYGVSFQMMSKVKVNGSDAHPLYQWLTAEAPGILGSKGIKWNFTKFLVGRDGRVIKRYAPQDSPEKITKDIEAALAA